MLLCDGQLAFCSGLKTKKWRELEQHSIENHSTNSSMGRAADLHSGGSGFESSWWIVFFFLNVILFAYTFLKFNFHTTVTWHSKHAPKQDLSKIKFTSSGNSTMVIANGYLLHLFFTACWRHWCGEKTGNSCGAFLSKPRAQQWVQSQLKTNFFLFLDLLKHVFSSVITIVWAFVLALR